LLPKEVDAASQDKQSNFEFKAFGRDGMNRFWQQAFNQTPRFNNGVSLNDHVTSFEVFNTSNCGVNRSPSSPTLKSPSDNSNPKGGLAPNLCWNTASDPDGDSLQYYAEVLG
jgi:hypothetical protein